MLRETGGFESKRVEYHVTLSFAGFVWCSCLVWSACRGAVDLQSVTR